VAVLHDDRVQIDYDAHVATVRLVRADKHNALDFAMFEALDAATDELRGRNDVRAVVIYGEGPSFCSGLDFPSFMASGDGIGEQLLGRRDGDVANLAQRVSLDWLDLPVPVIAALHGNALGGGCQIALGADVRFAAPDLRMSVLEIKYGLIPDMGITRSLPRLVPLDVAKELTWTGRIVEADEALGLGLVTRLADDPVAEARALAAELASKSPHAIRAGKQLLNEAWGAEPGDILALETAFQRELLGSPNQIAAVQAALAKQDAEFADPD
jgi:enoyl-CoA hydratase/carnithine racemase